MFLTLFHTIFADNIILDKKTFGSLEINSFVYHSSKLHENQSLKVSFPGTFVYKLVTTDKINYVLEDHTVYFESKPNDIYVYVTAENMKYGLMEDTINIITLLVTLFVVLIIADVFFLYLCSRQGKNNK